MDFQPGFGFKVSGFDLELIGFRGLRLGVLGWLWLSWLPFGAHRASACW